MEYRQSDIHVDTSVLPAGYMIGVQFYHVTWFTFYAAPSDQHKLLDSVHFIPLALASRLGLGLWLWIGLRSAFDVGLRLEQWRSKALRDWLNRQH